MTGDLQLYEPLDAATEAALRHSIRRFGVIYPVVVSKGPWRAGVTIDGHHRSRIARELGMRCDQLERRVRSEEEAKEIARTLNEDRRQLPVEQRREIVADLRKEGHSERAIAGALGVSQPTVHRDIGRATDSGESVQPDVVRSLDGKDRAAVRPKPKLKPNAAPTEAPPPTHPTPEEVMEPTDDERLYLNYLSIKERFGRVLRELLDLDAEKVGAVLLDLGHEETWKLIDSTLNRDLLDIDSWFRSVVAVKRKPLAVVHGGA